MKICSKCGVEKEDSEFIKTRKWCRPCRKEYYRCYRIKNILSITEKKKKRWEQIRDVENAKHRIYWHLNKKRLMSKQKEWCICNVERLKLYKLKYYAENKSVLNKKTIENYHNNKEKYKKKHLEWNNNNQEKVLAYARKKSNRHRETLSDKYIVDKLKINGLGRDAIEQYPLLIKLKRQQICNIRQLKE